MVTYCVHTGCSAGDRGSERDGGALSHRNLGYQQPAEVEVEDCR